MMTQGGETTTWRFELYVAGETAKSESALRCLREICARYFDGDCEVQVIDVLKNPELARERRIMAVPVLVRRHPLPERRVIGDLSHTEEIATALGLPG